MNRKQRVIIGVEKGLAGVCHAPKNIEVCVVDFDNAREDEDEHMKDKAEKWMSLAKRGLPLAECNAKSGYEGWYS